MPKVRHHPALLLFIGLCKLRFAHRDEIDLRNAVWTIPAERELIPGVKYYARGTKMRSPHLAPLSHQAIELLHEVRQHCRPGTKLVFPGDHNYRKPMSENTINKSLRVMGYDTQKDVCGHGFRTMAYSAQ
ncbi:tyrosine-type recombinase/integrase [Leclercia sp. UBA2479]|uniref:tyrosine-type recombinase/integrase n=1 Tax=Leclercia sp. UBA2479 TaxID=1946738 RepID=UPI0032E38BB5